VWVAVSLGPSFFEGIVTGESYLQILREYVVSGLHANNFRDLFFMQDEALIHFANSLFFFNEALLHKVIGRKGSQ
jgi:hypothetical protein